jgi:hypothetical protein
MGVFGSSNKGAKLKTGKTGALTHAQQLALLKAQAQGTLGGGAVVAVGAGGTPQGVVAPPPKAAKTPAKAPAKVVKAPVVQATTTKATGTSSGTAKADKGGPIGSSTGTRTATGAGQYSAQKKAVGIDHKFSSRDADGNPKRGTRISDIKKLGAAEKRFKFAGIAGRKRRMGKQRPKVIG